MSVRISGRCLIADCSYSRIRSKWDLLKVVFTTCTLSHNGASLTFSVNLSRDGLLDQYLLGALRDVGIDTNHVTIETSSIEWDSESMTMTNTKFWMVLGANRPTYRHETREAADKEAERLAKSFPGQEFIVLESLAVCKVGDAIWHEMEIIPF